MKRNAPRFVLWLLNKFCSGSVEESIMGDLLEQHQKGRGRIWFCFQALGIVMFRVLHSKNRYTSKQNLAILLLLGAVPLIFVTGSYAFQGTSVWPLLALGLLSGIVVEALNLIDGTDRIDSAEFTAPYRARIDSSQIRVNGGPGSAALITVLLGGVLIALPELRFLALAAAIAGPILAIAMRLWRRIHPPRPLETLHLNK